MRARRLCVHGRRASVVEAGPWLLGGPRRRRGANRPGRRVYGLAARRASRDDARPRGAQRGFNFLWTTFTRFDPASDLHAAGVELVRHHASFTPPIVIDARMKPGYPEELFCDEETAALVDRRWAEYFPGGGVEMGDSDRAHLD